MYKQLAATAFLATTVSAHGRLTSPTPRPLGDAMESACGTQVWNQMSSDPNGNIQTMATVGASQSDFNAADCHLWQCRGYQFADATSDSIQSFSAGQTVAMTALIEAPHTGVANVSVINLAENSVIDELISWSVYASTATTIPANETTFSVTMPDTLPDACATAGGCALQWWWDSREVDQTYMSCIDFAFSGSTSSSSSSSGSSSAVAASSSTVAATSASAQATTLSTAVATTTSSSAAAAATSADASTDNASSDDSTSCSKKRRARRARLAAAEKARV